MFGQFQIRRDLVLERRKILGDVDDIEFGEDRLFGLVVEQEGECGPYAQLWSYRAVGKALEFALGQAHFVTGLPVGITNRYRKRMPARTRTAFHYYHAHL